MAQVSTPRWNLGDRVKILGQPDNLSTGVIEGYQVNHLGGGAEGFIVHVRTPDGDRTSFNNQTPGVSRIGPSVRLAPPRKRMGSTIKIKDPHSWCKCAEPEQRGCRFRRDRLAARRGAGHYVHGPTRARAGLRPRACRGVGLSDRPSALGKGVARHAARLIGDGSQFFEPPDASGRNVGGVLVRQG